MSEYAGKSVAVIGLGRAGIGMAKTLRALGATVIAVDQKSADHPATLAAADQLSGLGIEVATSWTGDLDWDQLDVVCPSPGVPKSHPTLLSAVQRGIPMHSEIEVAYRISKAPIIAITGTNGKSTVTALTWHILNSQGVRATLCGNIAGSGFEEHVITTAALHATPDEVLVAEVSSFQLEWVTEFRPRAATIVQIRPDHLDRYADADEYAATKRRIFDRMSTGDTIVVHSERPETHPERSSAATSVAINGERCDALLEPNRLLFIDTAVEIDRASLWFPSAYNLEDCAFATLLARPFGSDDRQAAEAIATFQGLQNRMERVGEINGAIYFNNSMCTNPTAVESSLAAIEAPILLLAGGVSKVDDLSPLTRISPKIKRAFLFGRDADALTGALEAGGCPCESVGNMKSALSAASAAASSGDYVILAPGCASFDQFESFIERGDKFRELVRGQLVAKA